MLTWNIFQGPKERDWSLIILFKDEKVPLAHLEYFSKTKRESLISENTLQGSKDASCSLGIFLKNQNREIGL